MTRPELRPLTGVRGLFAWVVVLYHIRLSCAGWLPPGAIAVLAKGYLAVDVFFLLSGFVIALNYGDRLRGRAAIADFLVRRLARVWPLHLAMLAFAAGIATVLAATGRPAPHFPWAALPIHLAMMQDWGVVEPLMWNDPAWSISAEWAAYLLFPLALLAMPRRRLPVPMLLLAAAAPLALLAVAMAGQPGMGADIARFGVLRCLCEFSSGAALCAVWARLRARPLAEIAAAAFGMAGLVAWAAGIAETLAFPAAAAALLLALALGAERPRHPLGRPAIHWLGEISYATYLSHFLLFFAFKLVAVRDAADVRPGQIAVYLLIVLATSAALYHGLERPVQRLVLRSWRRRRQSDGALSVTRLRST